MMTTISEQLTVTSAHCNVNVGSNRAMQRDQTKPPGLPDELEHEHWHRTGQWLDTYGFALTDDEWNARTT